MESSLHIKYFIDYDKSNPNLKDFTLILPSVSVGNVGQLALDLLICSLDFVKVAIVNHPALLPLIGHDPYDRKSDNVTTAADLYINKKCKLIALQIRSMISKVDKSLFVNDLNMWLKSSDIKDVIILGSCYAHLRHDSQLSGSQFRYMINDLNNHIIPELESKGFKALEERVEEFGIVKNNYPGSGFLCDLVDKSEVPVLALLKFVDEGDNSNDAITLADYLNKWTSVKQDDKSWKFPFSWKNLFGPPPPSSLF